MKKRNKYYFIRNIGTTMEVSKKLKTLLEDNEKNVKKCYNYLEKI